jgi:Site-specific recombinase XerD
MASRKDSKGRVLYVGESERKNGYYIYQYNDFNGDRRTTYAKDLPELRQKKKRIIRDIEDRIDIFSSNKVTLNQMFDKYMEGKIDLRKSSSYSYKTRYDAHVRDSIGKKKLYDIKYSDMKNFYISCLKKGLMLGTIGNIHIILNPIFKMAVRDNLIRTSPTEGVLVELKKYDKTEKSKRHALTKEQQMIFMGYIAKNEEWGNWKRLFTVLLGTGMRIGELMGLTWNDVNFIKRTININHQLIYLRKFGFHIENPKSLAGVREIPMLSVVHEALEEELQEQKEIGFSEQTVDGYSRFVFYNSNKKCFCTQMINDIIKQIYTSYNNEELESAKKENREPVLIPHFSSHHFRHTFCTRFCENESNLKVIQEIMGHSSIKTTMDIYAEATIERKQMSFDNLEKQMKIF